MSTALLENTTSRIEEPQELVLDAVTRERLEVAACAVDTLEELGDSGAWERLDPALAQHLVQHAQRLCGFLERVRQLPAMRACEQEMLAVRRVERRLEVALDLLVEEEPQTEAGGLSGQRARGSRGRGERFLGDFSQRTLTDEEREQSRRRRSERKAAKVLLTPRAKRILLYVAACLVMTLASVTMVALGALTGQPSAAQSNTPTEPMKVNEYLEDVRVFLPAKMVMVQQNTAVVMVRREWLLRTPEQRQVDADGAHVYLSNRAITGLELLWEDGGLIARAGKDGHAVFVQGSSGLLGRELAEGDTEVEAAPAMLGPAPPPGP